MIDDDDDDFFLDDDEEFDGGPDDFLADLPPWTVLIVDDEPDIHNVTKLALRDFSFQGRNLELIGAHSAREAIEVYDKHGEIALILLDVVMESDHAGLDFARWLREERGDTETRIILRTGQPGAAPERQVVLAFDINDYKAKSELTSDRLFVAVVTALRGFAELRENARLRAEVMSQLAAQSEAERALMTMLPFPILHLDAIGQVAIANERLSDLAGASSPDELVGMPAADVLPADLAMSLNADETAGTPRTLRLGDASFHILRQSVKDAAGRKVGTTACLIPART
jgi:CheY-like chemotaxis protein